jgi:MYXO-CTERM domain-containing protein
MTERWRRMVGSVGVSSLLVLGLWLAAPAPRAQACGGFFCSAGNQVNQAAERILFAPDANGRVTMIVEIAYSGPSHEFAWLLPVPGEPEIGVSSNSFFMRLQSATNPSYTLTSRVEGSCAGEGGALSRNAGTASGDDALGDLASGGIDVSEGTVGPYDYALINVADAVPDQVDVAQLAIDWLTDNGYDVADTAPDLLRPYLEDGLNLLAFRLSKGNGTGSIRPVRLTYDAGLPSIPIRPTAVAATEDMGVMVWVVGDGRAVPKNYKHLELNEALINWFSPNSTYNQVVTMAADEAEGQGFVTEFAGPGDDLADQVLSDFERDQWQDLSAQQYGSGREAYDAVFSSYFGWDGYEQAIAQALMASDAQGYTAEELAECAMCVLGRVDVPPSIMLDALFASVIEPMFEATELLTAAPRVTRLYTTLSADEMTLDPVFDLNEELPDYSNLHTAEMVTECHPSISMEEAPWRMELASGDVVRGDQSSGWPIGVQDAPATQRIVQLGTRGEGEVVEDHGVDISAALQRSNDRFPSPGGCACSTPGPQTGAGGTPALAALLLLGLVVQRALRRRR